MLNTKQVRQLLAAYGYRASYTNKLANGFRSIKMYAPFDQAEAAALARVLEDACGVGNVRLIKNTGWTPNSITVRCTLG